ncbi:hypothetical protein OLMES_5513 [Oleiphilus messinensis]|uniref:Uncharacterized protein n=1 Tax=Oleiphilus messinensis TaxID=141451 RepID=A0A1Y0IJ84_9GAMM|nr:hypothetical protein [Oleiphilus messinensis]ARU59493.1 hypothetical protein OLMES_5513 [Oleiphilus messinensis]
MGKPTEDELKQALTKAAELREQGQDSDFVAKSLLSLNYRHNKALHVITQVKRYLHSGSSATEHARLTKLIEEFETVESGPHDQIGLL